MQTGKLLSFVKSVEVLNTELTKKKFASAMLTDFLTEEDLDVVSIIYLILNFFKKGMVITMTDFILDIKKWRCGADSRDYKTRIGSGSTSLKNEQGFSCCIGQFCKQIGIAEDKLLDIATPECLKDYYSEMEYPNLFDSIFVYKESEKTKFCDSKLSRELILINDNRETTVVVKVKELRATLEKYGHTLTIQNEDLIP